LFELRRLDALLREREVEMANRKSGRRASGIVALVVVIAAFAAPATATATPGKSRGAEYSSSSAEVAAPTLVPAWELADVLVIADASWAE